VRLDAQNWLYSIALTVPAGELIVSVVNPGGPTLESRWGLGFVSDAKLLQPGAEAVIKAQVRKMADAMLADAKAQF
jgi:hypothetical protein